MQQIFSNTTLTVNQLIEKIDTGELGLPELQRPFIWKDSKVRDLFDSMMCGYWHFIMGKCAMKSQTLFRLICLLKFQDKRGAIWN